MSVEQKPQSLPLWKGVLREMIESGLTYGSTYPASYFEKRFKCKRGTGEFIFAMMDLRNALERKHGYYLSSEKDGEMWIVPHGSGHKTVCETFDTKMRRYAARAVHLRAATLDNDKANLTDSERAEMQGDLERASIRLVLISRSTAVHKALKQHAPNLLK